MELIEYKNHFITYQRQGNDVNGNPVYLVNVFEIYKDDAFVKEVETDEIVIKKKANNK